MIASIQAQVRQDLVSFLPTPPVHTNTGTPIGMIALSKRNTKTAGLKTGRLRSGDSLNHHEGKKAGRNEKPVSLDQAPPKFSSSLLAVCQLHNLLESHHLESLLTDHLMNFFPAIERCCSFVSYCQRGPRNCCPKLTLFSRSRSHMSLFTF